MAKRGLNLKNMSNRRFRKTEDAIFAAYNSIKEPSAHRIVSKVHISRSTFYRHHKNIHSITRDYEKYILEKYSATLRPFLAKNHTQLKTIILQMLIFIMAHKTIFHAFLKSEHAKILEKLTLHLEPKFAQSLRLPHRHFGILAKEITGVIEEWGKTNFAESKLDSTLADIIFLVTTAKSRLKPLN
ncbi:hypothetical protein IKF57_02910 [Candidatus Saccharibacteria bacterium]|nr:hypothetical protein [Candidatus Saccharibacteria bacterium]